MQVGAFFLAPASGRGMDPGAAATSTARAGLNEGVDGNSGHAFQLYLGALCTETGIPVSSLCLSLKGGSHQGTWVHPQVAVDLARWISAPFAVGMDLGLLRPAPVAIPTQSLRTPREA
jgi:hypothetical protein